MAKTPNGHLVEPAIKTEIGDEVDRALKKLGAKRPRTGSDDPAEIYDALSKQGAEPELLQIVRHWRDKRDNRWALNELRRWNTGLTGRASS
jgi:hypothetical protein